MTLQERLPRADVAPSAESAAALSMAEEQYMLEKLLHDGERTLWSQLKQEEHLRRVGACSVACARPHAHSHAHDPTYTHMHLYAHAHECNSVICRRPQSTCVTCRLSTQGGWNGSFLSIRHLHQVKSARHNMQPWRPS